jgi:hypothetical protein
MRKKGADSYKLTKKLPTNMISGNQKTCQRPKNHVFEQKISKTTDKMMSWGMAAPFLMMPVTLQGTKNTWASKILFFELLVAQAVGHVYCWVSCLLPGLNPNFFLSSNVSYRPQWYFGETTFFLHLYFKKGSTLRPSLVASL